MYCKYCGKENKDGQKFCKYCGGNLQKKIGVPTPETKSAPISIDEVDYYDYDYEPGSETIEPVKSESVESSLREIERRSGKSAARSQDKSNKSKKAKRSNRAFVIIAIALLVMLMVAFGIFLGLYLSRKGKEAAKEDTVSSVVTENTEKTDTEIKQEDQESDTKWINVYDTELDNIKEMYHSKMVDYMKGMYGGTPENSNRTNADYCMRFELSDINSDGIPELFSYDSEGIIAWITTCKNGTSASTILFDNTRDPEGFSDYGAYATVDEGNNRICKYEYDMVFQESGSNASDSTTLGSSEYYVYLTVCEIDAENDITETDSYMAHYHFDEVESEDYYPYQRLTYGDFVEATHNDENISKEEFENSEQEDSDSIFFGNPMEGAKGYKAEDIQKLLNNEALSFKVDYININNSTAYVIRNGEYMDYSCAKIVMLSEFPVELREGDILIYSLADGWCMDDTQDLAVEDDGRNEAYAQIVRNYYAENVSCDGAYGGMSFNLIYFDDDDLPELVTNANNSFINLYTYSDGEVIQICDEWSYGAWGNGGYDFIEKKGIISWSDSDYAGALHWSNYLQWNPGIRDFEDLYDEPLRMQFFEDKNGNGEPDDDEYLSDDTVLYYYGDRQITEEEFESYDPEGDYGSLTGSMTYEEVLDKLGSPAGEKLRIVGASATSELNVASKDNATYIATNACDGDFTTAWVEGVAGNGEGQSITLYLDGVHNISRLKIYNGYLKTKRRYVINGKATSVTIDYGNGYIQTVHMHNHPFPEEEKNFEPYELNFTAVIPEQEVSTDAITIIIDEADAGSLYEDTAISEVFIFE